MSVHEEVLRWNQDKWELKNRAMYASDKANTWPWYSSELDPDVAEFIAQAPEAYTDILDLGTCSGSQAIGLAQLGYSVVGTEVSDQALIEAENNKSRLGNAALDLTFEHDDILTSKFRDNRFDLIFDRGCYNSICCFGHTAYIEQVKRILKPGGILLLKVMSTQEIRYSNYEEVRGEKLPMPHKFDKDRLQVLFEPHFEILALQDSFFYSVVIHPPALANLAVLKNTSG